MLLRALLAIPSTSFRDQLRRSLEEADVVVSQANASREVLDRVARGSHDLILVNRESLPDPILPMISEIRNLPDQPEVIVIDDAISETSRTELLASGCVAVLDNAAPDQALQEAVQSFVERRSEWLQGQVSGEVDDQVSPLEEFVPQSVAMQTFLEGLQRVAAKEGNVLLLGEPGAGKRRMARIIHRESARAQGPFVEVSCGGSEPGLLANELFGHEEGAFPGAEYARRGQFELAHGGILFLDEIGSLPGNLQSELLSYFRDGEVRTQGAREGIPVDVRVLASSSVNLEELVRKGEFSGELFDLLRIVSLEVPPLSSCAEDVPELVRVYQEHYSTLHSRDVKAVDAAASVRLAAYEWPGNVRELATVMERAVLLCEGETLGLAHFPDEISGLDTCGLAGDSFIVSSSSDFLPLPSEWASKSWSEAREEVLLEFERLYLDRLLAQTKGRINRTAELAGVQPRSIFAKMQRHGLRKEDYR